MKLFHVQVTGPNPARYRGLLGATDAEAKRKATMRHHAAGFPVAGHTFTVTNSYLVVGGSVVEEPADAPHTVHMDDGQLAEVEAALLDRIGYLEARVAVAKYGSPALPAYQSHLKKAQQALAQVMAV